MLKEFEILSCLWKVSILDVFFNQGIDILLVIILRAHVVELLLVTHSWNKVAALISQRNFITHVCLSEIIWCIEPCVLRIHFHRLDLIWLDISDFVFFFDYVVTIFICLFVYQVIEEAIINQLSFFALLDLIELVGGVAVGRWLLLVVE